MLLVKGGQQHECSGDGAPIERLLARGENPRRARVPVLQSFNTAQLAPQLTTARAAGVSYLIIMGTREVLDGTVLVRAMHNNSQEVVLLSTLPRYLKSLR